SRVCIEGFVRGGPKSLWAGGGLLSANEMKVDINRSARNDRPRHAVGRVAKLVRRLLPGASEHDCQIVASVRAALGHLAYFKALRSQLVEFAIYISLSSAKKAGVFSRCNNTIFPLLRRISQCALCGDCGRIWPGEKPLCKGAKTFAVHGRAESEAGRKDHGGRDEPFDHNDSLFLKGVYFLERVSLSIR